MENENGTTEMTEVEKPGDRPSFKASIESTEIYKVLSEHEKGDVIPYELLNKAGMGNVREEKYYALTTAKKMLLRGNQKVAAPVKGGIKILTDEDVVALGPAAIKRISNASKREMKKLATTHFDGLSNQDRIRHNTQMATMGALAHMASPRNQKKLEGKVNGDGKKLLVGDTLRFFAGDNK